MAYIIGTVSDGELDALRAAGLVDEDPPTGLLGPEPVAEGRRLRMFWVDTGAYSIMSGPDWEPVPHTPGGELDYTVILLRPDYIADEFGKGVFHAFVGATSPDDAVFKAQEAAAEADDDAGPSDYRPLFVCRGRVATLHKEWHETT